MNINGDKYLSCSVCDTIVCPKCSQLISSKLVNNYCVTADNKMSVDDENESKNNNNDFMHKFNDYMKQVSLAEENLQNQTVNNNYRNNAPETVSSRNRYNKSKKQSSQIRLQRVSQKFKKTTGQFWSGFMTYYTNENKNFQTHYWKLDSTSINIFISYKLERKLKEIPLNSIVNVVLTGMNLSREDSGDENKCLFMLKTENEIFYCGNGKEDQNSTMNVLARNFFNIFKMVYLPYGNRNGGKTQINIKAALF